MEVTTSSPTGFIKSPVSQNAPQEYYVNVTWTPTTSQIEAKLFCFTRGNEQHQRSFNLEEKEVTRTDSGASSGQETEASGFHSSYAWLRGFEEERYYHLFLLRSLSSRRLLFMLLYFRTQLLRQQWSFPSFSGFKDGGPRKGTRRKKSFALAKKQKSFGQLNYSLGPTIGLNLER